MSTLSPDPPTFPTPQQMRKLIELRRTIIEAIEAATMTTEPGPTLRLVTDSAAISPPDIRHSAVGTALNAVAYASGDISKEDFLKLADEAYYQLKLDDKPHEAG